MVKILKTRSNYLFKVKNSRMNCSFILILLLFICFVCREPFLHEMLIHSTFLLLKHTVRPMDLVAIDTIARRVYSFLSVTWGMVADIDIGSERFRNLGNARFTLEAITRILSEL